MFPFDLFFVSRAKYNALIMENSDLVFEKTDLLLKYLKVKDAQFSQEELRGIEHLLSESKKNKSSQFTKAELKQLFLLCHPDKHFNSDMSVALSQRINQLRGNL